MTFKPNFFFDYFKDLINGNITADTKSKQTNFKAPHFRQSKNFNYQSVNKKKLWRLFTYKRTAFDYFHIKMETSYVIPNLENKKMMWVLAQNHFLPYYVWKVYKKERSFSRANSSKISRISH